ncbi:unnamed protein product [Protopolystoma xenopodis]|uniref:Uncharacterized protein n=1 Tax=Protopolystoma xenopodis TaxID=117903 RepID=A0A448XH41_9PLAT|nr:unnamed protein product [Protopolystoma xenopodis]
MVYLRTVALTGEGGQPSRPDGRYDGRFHRRMAVSAPQTFANVPCRMSLEGFAQNANFVGERGWICEAAI